jgi:hypothetical protein
MDKVTINLKNRENIDAIENYKCPRLEYKYLTVIHSTYPNAKATLTFSTLLTCTVGFQVLTAAIIMITAFLLS